MSIILPIGQNAVPALTDTSGKWSFSVTRNQIIQQAMLYIGILGEAEVPTAQETQDIALALNMLVKQWMGKQDFANGLKMWERQRGDLFLGYSKFNYGLGPSGDHWAGGVSGATGNYNQTSLSVAAASGATVLTPASIIALNVGDQIGIYTGTDILWTTITVVGSSTITVADGMPNVINAGAWLWNYTITSQQPLEIVTSILRDINQNDIPQNKLTIEQYEALPTKTATDFRSDPTAFYYEFQLGTGQYYIDCGGAQDVTKHLHIVYLRAIQDFENPGDTPEYPQAWYRALCWGLARDIAPMFDAEWTQSMENNYGDALMMARETISDRTAAYFEPGNEG